MTEAITTPNNWQKVKVENISLRIHYGYTVSSVMKNTGTKLLRITDIQEYKVNWETVPFCEISTHDIEKYLLKENDIVFARTGATVGKSFLIQGNIPKSVFASYLIRIQLSKHINPQYLFYFFQSTEYWKQIGMKSMGIGQPSVNATSLSKISLFLCSRNEQNQIVDIIEGLFSKLDEAEKGLKKANEGLKIYKQVLLNEAFSGKLTERWREENVITVSAGQLINDIVKERQANYELQLLEWETSLKEWKKNIRDQRPSRPSKPVLPDKPTDEHVYRKWELPQEWQWTQLGMISFVTKLAGFEYTEYVKYNDKGDLPVIKAENAGREGFKHTIYSKVLAESVKHLKRSQLGGDELIIVFVGAGVGNVATLPKGQKFFLGPNIAMVRPYNGINSKFLEYFYQSPRGKKLLLAAAKAVAQPSLSMGNIRQTPIAVPSKEEQLYIVQIIENRVTLISKLEKTVDNVLNEIVALKHSILKKAFEGRLVNYTSDESIEKLLDGIQEEKRLYLESQKELKRSKPKQKKQMEEKKSILEILKESNSPIPAQELWEKSTNDGDIERFYSEIKEIYHQIDELKSKTESLLSLKNESK